MSLPLHLVDTGVWSRHGSSAAATGHIDGIARNGITMTCPPAALDYCFMARNKAEHDGFNARMACFKQPTTAGV